jgi:hypothetical protein
MSLDPTNRSDLIVIVTVRHAGDSRARHEPRAVSVLRGTDSIAECRLSQNRKKRTRRVDHYYQSPAAASPKSPSAAMEAYFYSGVAAADVVVVVVANATDKTHP